MVIHRPATGGDGVHMKGRILFVVGLGVGYVLGTRAGRERYEQMKSQARSVWKSPKVQEKATQAQDFAREKAPVVKEKAAEAAAAAKDKVSS